MRFKMHLKTLNIKLSKLLLITLIKEIYVPVREVVPDAIEIKKILIMFLHVVMHIDEHFILNISH